MHASTIFVGLLSVAVPIFAQSGMGQSPLLTPHFDVVPMTEGKNVTTEVSRDFGRAARDLGRAEATGENECFIRKVDFGDYKATVHVGGHWNCKERCMGDDGCHYWVFKSDQGICNLYGSRAPKQQKPCPNCVAGPKYCGGIAYHVKECHQCGVNWCSNYDIRYSTRGKWPATGQTCRHPAKCNHFNKWHWELAGGLKSNLAHLGCAAVKKKISKDGYFPRVRIENTGAVFAILRGDWSFTKFGQQMTATGGSRRSISEAMSWDDCKEYCMKSEQRGGLKGKCSGIMFKTEWPTSKPWKADGHCTVLGEMTYKWAPSDTHHFQRYVTP